MVKPTDIDMSQQWLLDHAADCGAEEAWVLVQGYPAAGFGWIRSGGVTWKLQPDANCLEWNLFSDVRLFGVGGEWHCWRDGKGVWRGRHAKAGDADWKDTLAVHYILWGEARADGDWFSCSEVRGAEVWVPISALPDGADWRRSIRLEALGRVAYQPTTGLAGITDLMLLGFDWEV